MNLKKKNNKIILGKKIFCLKDQENFAFYSGDNNPIHLDRAKSRKTIAGECIVHGIHSFLWALELFYKKNKYIHVSYEINFKKKIILDKEVFCIWDEYKNEISIVDNVNKLVSIRYKEVLNITREKNGYPINLKKKLKGPLEKDDDFYLNNLDPIKSENGGEIEYGGKIFPSLYNDIYKNLIYEIAILSNIIGMQIPGLYSLFSSCKIILINEKDQVPNFFISDYHEHLRIVNIKYKGKNINADLQAFALKKRSPSVLSNKIKSRLTGLNLYKDSKVLIIGGSRGIGSWVAKIIGLLAGEVTITYLICKEEAYDVCNGINSNSDNLRANSYKFDVKNDDYSKTFTQKYDYLFYFATPKIFNKESKFFDKTLYHSFKHFYYNAFSDIALNFIKKGGSKIFYPSSIAVEQNIKGLEEYKLAKRDGENYCNKLISKYPVKIIVDRLDRVDTDQTQTLVPVESKAPDEIAIDIAIKMASI